MPVPEPIEPPDGLRPAPPGPAEPGESRPRPDWLVGAEEGLIAELDAAGDSRAGSLSRPRLTRIVPPEPDATPPKPQPPKAWAAAATSVPKLSVVPVRERQARGPEMPDDMPAPSTPEEGVASPETAPVILPVRPLEEPLWLVWTEALAHNRVLQLASLAVVVAVVAYAYWPREGRGVPLREIRKNPENFEDRTVTVQGKVGEVFDMGSGYVFHLVQGRDTVVVFSSDRRPEPNQRVRVAGNVTTGYLDGVPRVAIFETQVAAPPR